MPDKDAMPTNVAQSKAAQILDGLARLLLIDDPAMSAPERRRQDAYDLRQLARTLAISAGNCSDDTLSLDPAPGGEMIRDSREWTAGLYYELQAGSGTPWQEFGWLDAIRDDKQR